jgi:hypothetical protein
MPNWSLDLPDDFGDHEWEVESKGWFDARLITSDRQYLLHFYDPVRLGQTMKDELDRVRLFFEPNLLVVQSVTRANMEHAVDILIESGLLTQLVAV